MSDTYQPAPSPAPTLDELNRQRAALERQISEAQLPGLQNAANLFSQQSTADFLAGLETAEQGMGDTGARQAIRNLRTMMAQAAAQVRREIQQHEQTVQGTLGVL